MSENSFYVPEGQGTEVSLIKWLQHAEEPVHEYMKDKSTGSVRATVPFSSTLKKSIIAIQLPQHHGHDTVRVFVKGAPEVVIPNCAKHYLGAGDNPQKDNMSEQDKQHIYNIAQDKMTSLGMRCLAFSYCDMDTREFDAMMQSMHGEIDSPQEIATLEGREQTFLALIALKDPLRTNIKDVIKNANTSRINLILVSGDNLLTSAAVAADVDILTR
jgi:magnesium-transporting ATPase (P-type)